MQEPLFATARNFERLHSLDRPGSEVITNVPRIGQTDGVPRLPSTSRSDPIKEPRKKYSGYKTLQISWHESIPEDFSPGDVLVGLADSHGLVVTDRTGKSSRRLRIDTKESARLHGRSGPIVDKTIRQDAAKLLRRAFKDPRTAERIRSLVERARRGEDVSKEMADAMAAET